MFEQRSPSTPDFPDEQAHVGLAQRIIASHTEHAAAEQTVASLRAAGLPADRATIVGSGLQLQERGRGQLSTADVTGRGAEAFRQGLALVSRDRAHSFEMRLPMPGGYEVGVDDDVVGVVAGAGVEGATAGDQAEPGVIKSAVNGLGREVVLRVAVDAGHGERGGGAVLPGDRDRVVGVQG